MRNHRHRLLPLLAASLAVAGCAATPRNAAGPAVAAVAVEPEAPWRGLIKPADLDRLNRVSGAWTTALAAARKAGFTRRLRGEGPLLDPATALALPTPAPGAYRCRLFRLGAGPRRRAYSVTGPFYCFVSADGPLLSLVRETGSPRPAGHLHQDGPSPRLVFIGTAAEGRETALPAYGERPERDVVGLFERVDNFRYRLVMPWTRNAPLEVYELVPQLAAS